MTTIDGNTLIEWGHRPAAWFKSAITGGNQLLQLGHSLEYVRETIKTHAPKPEPTVELRTNNIPFAMFLEPESDDERVNRDAVVAAMDALMRTPTIVKGAVMPDACPAGTIPVGGVVATENAIHPGFHSADICCSMAISTFKRRDDVGKVLDAAMKVSHFGPGGRSDRFALDDKDVIDLIASFENNRFLKGLEHYADNHFMTQGDGNHFFYVGEVQSTGQLAIVTHHGSRGLGAQLYRRGKAAAEKHTRIVAPRVPLANAWLPADTDAGREYWEALQIVRKWTKLNHFAIHRHLSLAIGNRITDQFWNEHNFVFRKSDGLFYHAKGATPAFNSFATDSSGATLIPLNMSQPILIAEPATASLVNDHLDRDSLGFAPHGAGRNMSRTAHIKRLMEEFGDSRGLGPRAIAAIMERETKGLDVRFYTGRPDVSELPSAYKNADQVRAQIRKHKLADVVDTIQPLGSIMAGENPWARR